MNQKDLALKAREYINFLSKVKPNRRTGSKGNKIAVQFFADVIEKYDFITDTTPFHCLDYTCKEPILRCDHKKFDIHVSPYSLPCDFTSDMVIVRNQQELENCECSSKILLMKEEICNEQLMPKNFVFYNPDHHKKIISIIETKKPAAIITATKPNPSAVGAIYPYPLIEDGDFNIPNLYCSEKVGNDIESFKDELFMVKIEGERIPSSCSNVIAIKNPNANEKIIICAHIDAYGFSPGASDNASGIAVLLLLAEFLHNYSGSMGIEIIAFNGEDHYSVGGQMDYLNRYSNSLNKTRLVINIDDVGYKIGRIAYSFYNCSENLMNDAQKLFKKYGDLVQGEQWYQGDHMIFVQKTKPCIAVTSECLEDLMNNITHTKNDTPEILDYSKIVGLSTALFDLIKSF